MSEIFRLYDSIDAAISFYANQQIILTIHPDGRLERGAGFATDDEASVAFFDCLSSYCLGFIAELRQRANEAERQLGECSGGYETLEKELAAANASLARVVEARDSLFAAIQHGDAEHRAWLKEAIDAHFAGKPVPPTRSALHRSQG